MAALQASRTAKASAIPAACGGVSERIIKKTVFLTVEGSLQLAAGNLQFGSFYKVVCKLTFYAAVSMS